jgi:hypothetical protein
MRADERLFREERLKLFFRNDYFCDWIVLDGENKR